MLPASGLASFSRRWATPRIPLHLIPQPGPCGASKGCGKALSSRGCLLVSKGLLEPERNRQSGGAWTSQGAGKWEMCASRRFSYILFHFSFEKTT